MVLTTWRPLYLITKKPLRRQSRDPDLEIESTYVLVLIGAQCIAIRYIPPVVVAVPVATT